MKISKLFHWLYAIVMLLPIFAIGVTCGYAMFNKNAYQSNAYYENITSIQITNYSNFEIGSNYVVNYQNKESTQSPRFFYTELSINPNTIFNDNEQYYAFAFYANNSLRFYYGNGLNKTTSNNYWKDLGSLNFTYNGIENTGLWRIDSQYVIYSRNFIEGKLTDIFYYSVDKVTQSNMFNWAYDSFLVAPFSYIVNLFSMPTNSPVVMLLSYWLSISIIWLTFDLVMYVPLLVHRWLDKGVLE